MVDDVDLTTTDTGIQQNHNKNGSPDRADYHQICAIPSVINLILSKGRRMPFEDQKHRSDFESSVQAQKGDRSIEHRREKRRPVDKIVNIMNRTKAIFDVARGDMEACSILDVSDNGCRIYIKNARILEIGTAIIIEYADGTRNYDRVCWTSGNEIGLKIDWKYSRVILDSKEQDTHDCKVITSSKDIIVIEFTTVQKFKIGDAFILESANGIRNQVHVKWIWENEIGLKVLKKVK
jgi:hypothetical protein